MAFLLICLIGAPEEFLGKVKELLNKHQTKFETIARAIGCDRAILESTPAYVMILWDNIKARQVVRDLKRSMKEGKLVIGLTEDLEWWPKDVRPARYEVYGR